MGTVALGRSRSHVLRGWSSRAHEKVRRRLDGEVRLHPVEHGGVWRIRVEENENVGRPRGDAWRGYVRDDRRGPYPGRGELLGWREVSARSMKRRNGRRTSPDVDGPVLEVEIPDGKE